MASMGRILIVEDEEKIARFLELELGHEGYEVGKATDGRAALAAALGQRWDLVLLDVMLPELSGLEVLRRFRRESDVPVILLTARDAVMDKVAGLDAGANDYITKPFAIEELLARIRAVLRQRPAAPAGAGAQAAPSVAGFIPEAAPAAPDAAQVRPEGVVRVGQVTLDPSRRLVLVGDVAVELTMREFDVLRVLMVNKGIVLSREKIASLACGYDYMGETNIVDVYVRHLRAKIDDRFGIKLVSTVRGVGYVVREG